MHKPRYCQIGLIIATLLVFHTTATAQLAYSPFTDGSVAYVALSGVGTNFTRGNPAALSMFSTGKRVIYSLESTHNHFDSPLQDYTIQLALTSRLTIGLSQSERTATTGATASGYLSGDPFAPHPLRWIGFGYRQNWSAGLGVQLSSQVAVGLSVRHEEYSISPSFERSLFRRQNFRTFDFGVRASSNRLNLGLVLRNFSRDRTSEPILQPIPVAVDGSSVIAWNPLQFPGIAVEPKFATEVGIHWILNSQLQLLGDVSSRKEYALGLRWRVFSKFFFTAGSGKRFDRIYTDEAVKYGALGAQFQDQRFAVAVTWIIPARSGRNRIVQTSYGNYDLLQLTNHQLLIGVAFSL